MGKLDRLKRAAAEIVAILGQIAEYSDARIAVIGGLAVWKYFPLGRETQDIDFIINIDSAPKSVKTKLLALHNSPFIQQADYFLYNDHQGDPIQVDLTPAFQSPYLPAAAQRLDSIPAGSVPYISPTDLLMFKMHSCGLRGDADKREQDAKDAETLLGAMTTPPTLTHHQQQLAELNVADVVTYGTRSEDWWRRKLGLPLNTRAGPIPTMMEL
ncbi:hypothetical protein CONLIGDRAFT_679579 [Coniochaeta ligniaria NRRL 30616]|uniref:Uncharacterized protein n=1 Tax=Coniochaeta ligniaria NRRL 30616 TaxID=1408157 RepID=A0A1J7JLT1_9PEZI|nr:hypothetical protein CONLIGDRAFT_679579 [Coniochaeta ligniaria NRRL 30616]